MKLEDLPEMFQQNGEMRIKSLEARLAYAKALLDTEHDGRAIEKWHKDRKAFIEKLNSENL